MPARNEDQGRRGVEEDDVQKDSESVLPERNGCQ